MNPITDEIKYWLGTEIRRIALEHDIGGPHISRVCEATYRKQLADNFRQRILEASAAKKILTPLVDHEEWCRLAAQELITIRTIRDAHETGQLSTEELRQLPMYPAYQDYFEEDASVVYEGLRTALKNKWKEEEEARETSSIGHTKIGSKGKPMSKQTRQWLRTQVQGFALAEDLSGAPCAGVDRTEYIAHSAPRFRETILRGIRIGDLHIDPDKVDELCNCAASHAYEIRCLKAAWLSGEISKEDLRRVRFYTLYQDYFEHGSELINMALTVVHPNAGPFPNAKN